MRGDSLRDSVVGIVGYGDIGRNLTKRVLTSGMKAQIYDPFIDNLNLSEENVTKEKWPDNLSNCDYIVLTCSLNPSNYHLINEETFKKMKHGVKIVNVSRGPLIDETQLIKEIAYGKVNSVALDVFENEPLPKDSPLREFNNCIFGSHNSSNTTQAVLKTSIKAIKLLNDLLK